MALTFEIIDHGCDGEQYFPGCGVALTRFTDCATGIGDSAHEAGQDALGQIALMLSPEDAAQFGPVEAEAGALSNAPHDNPENPEWHHYVTIRWTFKP